MKTQETIVIRPLAEIRSFFEYSDAGDVTLKPGSKINADELASVVVDDANTLTSQSLRVVNTLRLARALPAVSVGEKKTQDAFDYVLAKVEAECKTPSTFQNIKGLIECADIRDKNNLPCSPFAVKEAMGYLRKVGVIGEEAKLAKGTHSDPVVKALKGGSGVNALRPVIAKAKEKHPDKFKSGKSSGSGSSSPGSTEVPRGEDTPEKLALDLRIMLGRAEKLNVALGVDKARAGYREAVIELAKLAGVLK